MITRCKNKLRKVVLMMVMVALALAGCGSKVTHKNSNKVINVVENGFFYEVIVDSDTGVMYIRYDRGGISPLYNDDGSLKLYKDNDISD